MTLVPDKGRAEPLDPRADRTTADVGLVCSQHAEVRGTLRQLDRVRKYTDDGITILGGFLRETTRVAIVEAGNGYARHRHGAEVLIREHRPRWVFSIGFSSALSSKVAPGDLVLANHLADTHGNSLDVNCKVPESQRIHVGKVLVADQHPLTVAEKQRLAEQSEAIAVDTVSLAVAQICHEQQVRFLSIRGIVDGLEEQMPERAAELAFAPTSRAWGGVIGGAVRNLKTIYELNEWRTRIRTTSDHVGQFVCSAVLRIAEKLNR